MNNLLTVHRTKLSWKHVVGMKDKVKRESLLFEAIHNFPSLPPPVLVDWTGNIFREISQAAENGNGWRNIERLSFLRYKCSLPTKLVTLISHGYLGQMQADSPLLSASERFQMFIIQNEKRSVDYYPSFAAEILLSIIEQEPDQSVDHLLKSLIENNELLSVLCNSIRYGLFNLRFCALRLLKAAVSRSSCMQDIYVRDVAQVKRLIASVLPILQLNETYLIEELNTKRGSHQHTTLTHFQAVTDRSAIRHTHQLKEAAILAILNTLLLNISNKVEFIEIEGFVETVFHLATTLPSEAYLDSDILLASCNILYLLSLEHTLVLSSRYKTDDVNSHLHLLMSKTSNFVTRLYSMFKKLKAIPSFDAWVNKQLNKADTYQRITVQQIPDIIRKTTENLIRSETTILNILAELSTIEEYARQIAAINEGKTMTSSRMRPVKSVYTNLQMFMLFTTFDSSVVHVQPNDYSASALLTKNIYKYQMLDITEEKLTDMIREACDFVKQKAIICMKSDQHELALQLFSIILKIVHIPEEKEEEEISNLRIWSLRYRSECYHKLGQHILALSDSELAVMLHTEQNDRFRRQLNQVSSLVKDYTSTEASYVHHSTIDSASEMSDNSDFSLLENVSISTPLTVEQVRESETVNEGKEQVLSSIEELGYEPSFYDVERLLSGISSMTPTIEKQAIQEEAPREESFVQMQNEARNLRTPDKERSRIIDEEEIKKIHDETERKKQELEELLRQEEEKENVRKQKEEELQRIEAEVEVAVQRLKNLQEEERNRLAIERVQLEELQKLREEEKSRRRAEKEAEERRNRLISSEYELSLRELELSRMQQEFAMNRRKEQIVVDDQKRRLEFSKRKKTELQFERQREEQAIRELLHEEMITRMKHGLIKPVSGFSPYKHISTEELDSEVMQKNLTEALDRIKQEVAEHQRKLSFHSDESSLTPSEDTSLSDSPKLDENTTSAEELDCQETRTSFRKKRRPTVNNSRHLLQEVEESERQESLTSPIEKQQIED